MVPTVCLIIIQHSVLVFARATEGSRWLSQRAKDCRGNLGTVDGHSDSLGTVCALRSWDTAALVGRCWLIVSNRVLKAPTCQRMKL